MKDKVVRLPRLNRLHVHSKNPNQGVGPCAMELSAVLTCWSNVRGGTPDAAECKSFVNTLTNCMRGYVCFSFCSEYGWLILFQRKPPVRKSTVNYHL
jgi:hypothetical protein